MHYRDLVVIGENAIAVSGKDATNPVIPKEQSSAARSTPMLALPWTWLPCAIAHRISLCQNRRRHLEIAVDDADDRGVVLRRLVHLPCLTGDLHSSAGSDGRAAGGSDGPAKMIAHGQTQFIVTAPLLGVPAGRGYSAGA